MSDMSITVIDHAMSLTLLYVGLVQGSHHLITM